MGYFEFFRAGGILLTSVSLHSLESLVVLSHLLYRRQHASTRVARRSVGTSSATVVRV
jgi:hypothetical protein